MPVPPATLAKLHGVFNVANGLWPLVHLRSFEAVLGPKVDRWLVYTVAGLLTGIGAAQFISSANGAGVRQARLLGIGTALTLGGVDAVYAPAGRISRMYLVDAAMETGWLLAWATTFSTKYGGPMSNVQPPSPKGDDETPKASKDDDSVVAPPAYPAYSTPPPEGLHTGEDG